MSSYDDEMATAKANALKAGACDVSSWYEWMKLTEMMLRTCGFENREDARRVAQKFGRFE